MSVFDARRVCAAACAALAAATLGAAAPPEYRSIDGVGNNRQHPLWGTPGAQLLRQASGFHYGDTMATMGGEGRPGPRDVSNAIFDQRVSIPSATGVSDFIWTWGQFLDHDLSLTEGAAEAVPIAIPVGDLFFDPLSQGL
jgi:hypothetical protein